ncbi:hypothetical protein Bca101_029717 [Brassica carinata]
MFNQIMFEFLMHLSITNVMERMNLFSRRREENCDDERRVAYVRDDDQNGRGVVVFCKQECS